MKKDIKKYLSGLGKKSWEARLKKYGKKKALDILSEASKKSAKELAHKKLSTPPLA